MSSGIVVGVLALMLMLAARAAAEAHSPLQVVVLGENDAGQELVARLQGQTSDLEVHIATATGKPIPALTDQHEGVAELAGRYHADVLVWFEQPDTVPGELVVHIVDATSGTVLVRRLAQADASPTARSSTQEAAALIVRESLRAVLAGLELSLPTSRQPVRLPPRGPAESPRTDRTFRRPVRPYAALGWAVAVDGESALGHQGPSLSLGLGWASLDVSLFANAGIPVQLESAYATLRLARYVLGARTSYRLAVSRRLDLDLGVRAGWVVYHRSTEPNQPNVTPTSARDLAAAMVGIELGLELYPTDSDWAFVLLGGVDALPKVPRIVYQRDEEPIEAARPTILQPHLGIALRLGGRRSHASPR